MSPAPSISDDKTVVNKESFHSSENETETHIVEEVKELKKKSKRPCKREVDDESDDSDSTSDLNIKAAREEYERLKAKAEVEKSNKVRLEAKAEKPELPKSSSTFVDHTNLKHSYFAEETPSMKEIRALVLEIWGSDEGCNPSVLLLKDESNMYYANVCHGTKIIFEYKEHRSSKPDKVLTRLQRSLEAKYQRKSGKAKETVDASLGVLMTPRRVKGETENKMAKSVKRVMRGDDVRKTEKGSNIFVRHK
jgi:hypothetical protein